MAVPPWLLKIAAQQALDPKNWKRLLYIICGVILSVLLLSTAMLLPLSFLNGEKITNDYDISQSAAYKAIYPIYEAYQTELRERLNVIAEDIKDANKKWVEETTYNPETGTEESSGHYEYPAVDIVTATPPIDVLLAYLVQKDENLLKAKKYEPKEEEIKEFYNSILKIETTGGGDSFTVTASFLTMEEIADKYFTKESEKSLFYQSIALIKVFLRDAAQGELGSDLNLNASAMETMVKIFTAMTDAGYSTAVAAGVCGNIQQECGFNYKLSGAANGMVQWMGTRFERLKQLAEEKGATWQELDVQIEFLLSEMDNPAYKKRLNQYASKYGQKSSFAAIDDPEMAAFIFCAIIEGCEYNPDKGWGIPAGSIIGADGKRWQQLEQRQAYALKIYQAMSGGGSSSLGSVANGTSSQKLAALFPNGLPKSQAEMNRYTESIPIFVWDGSKKVTKYVVLHKALKEDVQEIFEDIADAHIQLKSIGGIRSFGSSMNNGGSSVSHHCYGVAIDLDPDYNPSGVYDGNPVGVKPSKSYYYTHPWQPKTHPLSISPESVIVRAFESRGWVWGAKWGTVNKPNRQPYSSGYHDFMHFSFTGH